MTDKLAVLRSRKIDIYDAETMELEIEINVGQYPKYIDADQGKLVIGYGTDQIDVYDLKTNSNLMTLKADAVFSELAIDAQIIIYADKDDVYFHNYLTGEKTIFDNGEISVYTAYIDNEYLTYVYDLNADANIYEIRGKASNACLLGNALFIFDDGSDLVRKIPLE